MGKKDLGDGKCIKRDGSAPAGSGWLTLLPQVRLKKQRRGGYGVGVLIRS